MSENVQSAPRPDKGSTGSEFVEIVKTVVYALLIALVLRVLFFQPFTIPSASMEPNLFEGDYIIVSKYSYGYSRHSIPFSPPVFSGRLLERKPQRGDVVVFKLPRDNRTDYVKRIVGLPGDRIQMRQDALYVNDQAVPTTPAGRGDASCPFGDATDVPRFTQTLPGGKTFTIDDCTPQGELDSTDVFVVPEGYYFMMGDNRDNSSDSRVPAEAGGVGFVPAENLVGKAQIVLLSWHRGASIFKPWTWVLNARPSRFFHLLQ